VLLIDEVSRAALEGSRPADELIVWAWYDGALVVDEALQINSWSFSGSADASSKVQRQLNLTIADPDGSLSPWLFHDPLGVGGTVLRVIYRIGASGTVNVDGSAWKKTRRSRPTGSTRSTRTGTWSRTPRRSRMSETIMVPSGGTVVD
jgi:hypothetical protein